LVYVEKNPKSILVLARNAASASSDVAPAPNNVTPTPVPYDVDLAPQVAATQDIISICAGTYTVNVNFISLTSWSK
jgi:hypothetical protein